MERKKIKQISRMENPESQATQYQRKKIKQISRMENPESQATQYQRKKIKQMYSVACDSGFSILHCLFGFI
jgi:hypothetical protein